MIASKIILAIDPGSRKCGFAVAQRIDGIPKTLDRSIVAKERIEAEIERLVQLHHPNLVVLGNGTGSRQVAEQIREALPSLAILIVNEDNTTQEARELYWLYHGRKGWRRLLPSSLIVPQEPFDDFAALVLAHRVLAGADEP